MGDERKNDDNNDWRELLKNAKKQVNDKGGNPFKGGKFRFSMWYLILAMMLIGAVNMMLFRGTDRSIPYSEFKALVANGVIKEVNYTGSSLIGYSFVRSAAGGGDSLR